MKKPVSPQSGGSRTIAPEKRDPTPDKQAKPQKPVEETDNANKS